MPATATETHRFRVRALHEDGHHGRLIDEASFEAAAIAYAEHMPHTLGLRQDISIVVHDVATGHEHRYRIDLDSGETTQQA